MTSTKPRRDAVDNMIEANGELADLGFEWDERLFYLVNKFKPTFIELRTAFHRLTEFIYDKPEERGKLAKERMRADLKTFNKKRTLDQMITSKRATYLKLNGKMGTTWIYVIGEGDTAKNAQARELIIIKGHKDRVQAWQPRIDDPVKYKAAADAMTKRLDRARQKGKTKGTRKGGSI